jgi:hypothetical protein
MATVVATTFLVIALAACGSTVPGPASPSASPVTVTAEPTLVPSSAFHATPIPTASPPSRTKTAWGTIWDGLPRGFPTPPGAEPTDTGDPAPVSAALAIPSPAAATADWYRTALPAAGYSVEGVSGPYENGGFVIDAVGPSAACRVQVSLARTGTTTTATILLAAACPFRS